MNDWSLNSMPLWSMGVKEDQAKQFVEFAKVVTVEDHLMDGGFGSWLLESATVRPGLLARIKVKSWSSKVCGLVGKQATFNVEGGLVEDELCV